jgi:hypothetical protein
MPVEVVEIDRHPVFRQIRRRSANAHMLHAKTARSETRTVLKIADPHREVKTFFNKIHCPVREGDIDLQLRVLACEFEQDRRDAVMPESNRHAHAQAAARLGALAFQIGFRNF